jgi:ATP-dependent Clp protease adaptor protein ClpS
MADRRRQEQGDTQTKPKVEEPRKFKVLLHNDDYTTMEFVVFILESVFHHSQASATRIMLSIHKTGIGIAGVYTREVAETRCEQVTSMARKAGHPLQVSMEPE